jgi:adenylate cyclase
MELTAFFSDIEKFSTISEKLGSPKVLVELLNEYLTAMTDTIEQYDGTIDKYEGDAVIAFWGAPAHFTDHALKACYACLDMQAKMKELRERWRNEGRWPQLVENMRVRMGVNTGPMVVGNMGSKGHLSYTIMGDAVNLASRLEGANKVYGTHIMLSHDTYWLVRGFFEVRFLDIIAVVGKDRPVRVYELLARRGQLDPQTARTVRAYNDGMVLFRKKQWQEALSSFEAALHFIPDDGPSKTYIERCREYLQNPPPPDWDGVFKLQNK